MSAHESLLSGSPREQLLELAHETLRLKRQNLCGMQSIL